MCCDSFSFFLLRHLNLFFFFLNDTAPTEIYPLPLPDALPISAGVLIQSLYPPEANAGWARSTEYARHSIKHYSEKWLRYPYPTAINIGGPVGGMEYPMRSEEHTSELQSPCNLVCRLLLEKKKK